MNVPYLLIGVWLPTNDPAKLLVLEATMRALETELAGKPMTALSQPGVYHVRLDRGAPRPTWRKVTEILWDADRLLDGDLQWFVNLNAPNNHELSHS